MEEDCLNVLPQPDAPTKATVLPDGIFSDSLFKTYWIDKYWLENSIKKHTGASCREG